MLISGTICHFINMLIYSAHYTKWHQDHRMRAAGAKLASCQLYIQYLWILKITMTDVYKTDVTPLLTHVRDICFVLTHPPTQTLHDSGACLFLTWLLIGWQLCCQPIRSYVRKFHNINILSPEGEPSFCNGTSQRQQNSVIVRQTPRSLFHWSFMIS